MADQPASPPDLRPYYRPGDFWLGFTGWYAINGRFWIPIKPSGASAGHY